MYKRVWWDKGVGVGLMPQVDITGQAVHSIVYKPQKQTGSIYIPYYKSQPDI